MNHSVPFPDHFSTGLIDIDGIPSLRPGDMIRVVDSGSVIEEYEVLSIREDDSVVLDVESMSSPEHMTAEEFREALSEGVPYVWTLLNRAVTPIEDSVSESLVLFAYAFNHHELPQDQRMIAFVWSVTQQDPVTTMPEVDGMVSGPRFDDLRDSLTSGEVVGETMETNNALGRLHETFNDPILEELLDGFIVVAEYNAVKLFEFHTEPTYDEATKERIDERAITMEESINLANSLYD